MNISGETEIRPCVRMPPPRGGRDRRPPIHVKVPLFTDRREVPAGLRLAHTRSKWEIKNVIRGSIKEKRRQEFYRQIRFDDAIPAPPRDPPSVVPYISAAGGADWPFRQAVCTTWHSAKLTSAGSRGRRVRHADTPMRHRAPPHPAPFSVTQDEYLMTGVNLN